MALSFANIFNKKNDDFKIPDEVIDCLNNKLGGKLYYSKLDNSTLMLNSSKDIKVKIYPILDDDFKKILGNNYSFEDFLYLIYNSQRMVLIDNKSPLIVESISDDSRYDIQNDCIVISDKVIMNYKEALKCVIHETRHIYQRMIIDLKLTSHPFYETWKDNFKEALNADPNNINQVEDYFKQPIEIDAFAFTKYIFKKYFDEDLLCFDLMIEDIFNLYIEKYLVKGL